MKKNKHLIKLASIALLFAATSTTMISCSSDDDSSDTTIVETQDELVGSIVGERTLDPSITYTITGPVIVEEGGVLNIPAGTTIKAKKVSIIIF